MVLGEQGWPGMIMFVYLILATMVSTYRLERKTKRNPELLWCTDLAIAIQGGLVAFLVADLAYYWYHRAGHSVAALWAIHGVHHQCEEFNLSVSARHPWFSDLYSAFFYAPLPLLGIGSGQFFVAISAISFYSVSIHSLLLKRPGLFIFTTPQTHIVHHANNPRYLHKNFGAMFTLWDRIFGTHVEVDPADPPRLGVPVGYLTHDGARSQWIFFDLLFQFAARARSLGERFNVFVMHPGWRPEGVAPCQLERTWT